jgi:hypothetical protein
MKGIGTPCDDAPWIKALKHGTMHAYSKYGCRCIAAVKARNDWRTAYMASPAGQAYRERQNRIRRTGRRDPSGLTVRQLLVHERRSQGQALLRAGHSQTDVARRTGVHVRTVQRWVAAWRQ